SAPGLLDLRPTPVAQQYIGVEAHANAIAGLLHGGVRAIPPRARAFEIAGLILLAGLMGIVVPRLGPRPALFAIAAAVAAVIAINIALWTRLLWVLPLATSLMYLGAASFLLLNFNYFVEVRRKRGVQRLMSQYVPPALVEQLDPDDVRVSLEGESREMSVLFSDVRGFTSLSEGLSPRELTQLMNAYLTPITAVIGAHRGTIDKYIGDAVMAFWGAPLADEQHATHAVLAALGMQRKVAELGSEFAARGWPALQIGIGVSTGVMNVGNMGSDFRVAYTVLGDAVNLGSRLEGLTKQYGVGILISQTTYEQLQGVVCREIDRVRVKGRAQPVAIYEPLVPEQERTPQLAEQLSRWSEFLRLYRCGDVAGASDCLAALEAAGNEELYGVYRDRLTQFRVTPPPPDWDGV
ncbi:MAG: CHASE2 domain-containing protein, partial [Steroidobacteraceae bacterium]|nr:CHASE2 domain-containing protein [Steroidobacteraceae bacterium]